MTAPYQPQGVLLRYAGGEVYALARPVAGLVWELSVAGSRLRGCLDASTIPDGAKEILRRRLRGVLWQARAWKSEAVSRGWTGAEDRAAWQALRSMRAEAKARRRAAAKGGR